MIQQIVDAQRAAGFGEVRFLREGAWHVVWRGGFAVGVDADDGQAPLVGLVQGGADFVGGDGDGVR